MVPLAAQGLFVALVMLCLPLVPPVSGRILLFPLGNAAAAMLPRLAVNAGASLVSAGPFPGSFIVDGRRDSLFAVMTRHDIVMIAAFGGGCGKDRSR